MRKVILSAMIVLLAAPAFAADGPKTEEEKVLYTIGVYQARQLGRFNFTPKEFDMVKQGFADAAPGKQPKIKIENYSKKVQELAQSRRAAQEQKTLAAGQAYQEQAVKKKGAVKTPSGLIYIPERDGKGATPTPSDTVSVHYRGTLVDGTEFDSTRKDKTPAEFKVDKVIKCWTEGLQLMKPGGKATLVCPPELAYGKQGAGSIIPPDSTLIFEIELLGVRK